MPKTTKRPLTMIAILSHSYSASSILCVVSNTEAIFIFLIMRLRERRETGSTPVVGSSKNRIRGLSMIAYAAHSLRLLPPLRFLAIVCLKGVKSRFYIMSLLKTSLRSPLTPLRLATKLRLSSTVISSHIKFSWLQIPKNFPWLPSGILLTS